jgi:hypothetical protein
LQDGEGGGKTHYAAANYRGVNGFHVVEDEVRSLGLKGPLRGLPAQYASIRVGATYKGRAAGPLGMVAFVAEALA